jgi:hypothetical protein
MVIVIACAGNDDLRKYCTEAAVLAQVFDRSGDVSEQVDHCVKSNQAALDSMSGQERDQAEACIECIARTKTEECGCCTTNGEYDVVRSGECKAACDTAGHKTFCDK